VREIQVSSFSDFYNSFQSLAAENWKERRPKELLALGMTSEIYLLERVLQVGVIITTSELITDRLLPKALGLHCCKGV
jgi:hypothetical protein